MNPFCAASLILFSLLPSLSAADAPLGGPPWTCHVAAACNGRTCISLPRLPMSLRLEATDAADVLLLDGEPVGFYDTYDAARMAVVKDEIPSDARLILVRSAMDPADAIGFSAFAPSWHGEQAGLSDDFASLVCSG